MFRVFSIACLLTAVACVSTADASLRARLDDLAGNVAFVWDNMAGDLDPDLGEIEFNGPLGGGGATWTVRVTASGAPVLGQPGLPNIDMNVEATGVGTLNIRLSQDFNAQTTQPISFSFAAGGDFDGSFVTSAYADSSNTLFSTTATNPIAVQLGSTLGPWGPGAFSGSTTGSALGTTTGAGVYSVTIDTTLNHSQARQTSIFNAELEAVIPEPASFAAWGLLGLMGMGLVWFKRRRS